MMTEDLEYIILSEDEIQKRVSELARDISRDYKSKDLSLIGILKGGIVFLADLTRKITISHSYDMVGASSYGSGASSSGKVIITKDVDIPLKGKDILLIEDIYDTGTTLKVVKELLDVHSPRSIEICALLWKKKKKRYYDIPVKYVGFEVPDVFVVGYGLDFNQRYRNLPCIGVLKKEFYT